MEKLFTGPGDKRLPPRIKKMPKKKREQWAAVWNSVFTKCMKDKRKKRSTCETQAFRVANGVVKTNDINSITNVIEDFISLYDTTITVFVSVSNPDILEVEHSI